MEKAAQFHGSEAEDGEFVPGLDLVNDDVAEISNHDLCICEVCNKEFTSRKSLGGHMRVHTQLLKSAKKPPPPLKIEEPRSCGVCDKQFTSQRSLWGHMKCHSTKALKPDDESKADEEDEVYSIVSALMLLATGDERYRLISKEDQEEEERNLRKRKRKRQEDGVYECEVCCKCFGSYQALGGHRSSAHTKKMQSIMSAEMVEKAGHVCKICDKEFASGQALGGHQRCHWRGSYGSSSSSAAADGGEGNGGGRPSDEGKTVVFDFDLNELPPAEENGDGDQPAEM